MIRMTVHSDPSDTCYHGIRMSAEQYLNLPESECKYELIDGVVFMSPSATPLHQKIITRLAQYIANHLDDHPIGEVYVEVDVNLGAGLGRDLVYRPDVVYLRAERAAQSRDRIVGPPDLVVEVISPDSRQYDSVTKKDDYESCGVLEYWLIDPFEDAMRFYARRDDQFVEIQPEDQQLVSQAIPGLVLDLERIRRLFKTGK